jgi:3-oxoacyl-[acyl-carrier protein] reductase
MSGPLQGRAALVVGGARGIGGAVSAALARDGACVAALYHGGREAAAALVERAGALGHDVLTLATDVRDEATFRSSLRAAVERLGPIDVLVYCAGIANAMPVVAADMAAMRAVFEVNYWPAVVATRTLLPAMLARRFGRLLFVTSATAERTGIRGQAAYAGTKAALNALVRSLAAEVSRRGDLTANAIAAGPIRTRLTAAAFELAGEAIVAATPAGRFGEPEEVAEMVAFLASDRAAYVTGQVVYVDGGFSNGRVAARRRIPNEDPTARDGHRSASAAQPLRAPRPRAERGASR